MRILSVVNSVYEKSLYSKNEGITGLSIMVREICEAISKECECYVLTYMLKNDKRLSFGNLYILQSGIKELIKYFNFKLFLQGVAAVFSKNERHLLRQSLFENYFLYLQKKIQYNLINFHDLTTENVALIEICEKYHIPYVVTMHMYIGQKYNCMKDITTQYSVFQSNCNKVFSSFPQMKVITISSGMKKRILEDYPKLSPENYTVILNSSKYIDETLLLEKGKIYVGKKIILIIGSVQTRKNQIQLFSTIKYIPESIKSEIEFHFIGNDNEGILNRKIKENNLEDTCKYLGIIPHKDLAEHYNNCFATMSLCLLESFGLTFIESFAFGKPVIMFDDLDAFEDIYSEDCCVPITEHTDEAVANAIINCVNKTWDEAKIKQHAKKFNMDTLRESYISLYNNILNNDTTENNSRNRL